MDDLFSNPALEIAKKGLTPEQKEEYKRIGEYMYNNPIYNITETGSKVTNANATDLIVYATQALKSGLNPSDLSQPELEELVKVYGEKWYERFGLERDDVPTNPIQVIEPQRLSRQERRAIQRSMDKESRKGRK